MLNLYLVTETLQRLLAFNVGRMLTEMGRGEAVTVTTSPPELITTGHHKINVYLHHADEAPYHRRAAEVGGSNVSITRPPLALSLSYVVTAHHATDGMPDAREEQLLFGLAMKTLHDHPMIDDATEVASETGGHQLAMPPELRGTDSRLDISLRPTTVEEATRFWSAEGRSVPRIAAFYDVRTIVISDDDA